MLHDTAFAVAFEGVSGIEIITNQLSPWVFYSLPSTGSSSESPSIFYDYSSAFAPKIYVAYDNTSDGDVHMSYWDLGAHTIPSFSGPYTVSNGGYAAPNVTPSISVDGTGRVHFAWDGFDHSRYYQYSVFHRSLSMAGFNWSTITQFVYYSVFDEPLICGHTDANGGVTLMFHDESGNNNIYKLTSTDGINWGNVGGFGLPPTMTNNAVYPNLVSSADPSSVAYSLTRLTTPYALSIGLRNENTGGGSVLYKRSKGITKFSQIIQAIDTIAGLNAVFDLSSIRYSSGRVTADTCQIEEVSYDSSRYMILRINPSLNGRSTSNASALTFYGSLNVNKTDQPVSIALALVDSGSNAPVVNLMGTDISGAPRQLNDSAFSVGIPLSALKKNTKFAVLVNGVPDSNARLTLVNVYFINDTSSSSYRNQTVNSVPLPMEYDLSQNYPNPFNPSTVISYQLPVNTFVMLKVYDALGREVKTLVNEDEPAGYNNIVFDGSSLPSGLYFYRLTAGKYTSVKKLMLVK